MTNRDILVQILHETTGESKESLNEKMEFIKKLAPTAKLDEEVADAEALLNKLRQEKGGIALSLLKAVIDGPRRPDA